MPATSVTSSTNAGGAGRPESAVDEFVLRKEASLTEEASSMEEGFDGTLRWAAEETLERLMP